jgi:hypothetical protein
MDGNYGTARRTAARAALTALLALLLAPAGASASVSLGPAAQLPGVVQDAGESLSQGGAGVDRGVGETLASARRAVTPVAGSVPSTPVPPVEVAPTIDRVAPAAVHVAAPKSVAPAAVPASPESRPGTHGTPRRPVPGTGSQGSPRTPERAAGTSARPYASPAARPAPATRPESQAGAPSPGGIAPAGHALEGATGSEAAASGFSAVGFAVLLMSFFLAGSALRTRLPRFLEAAPPLPLVFALERPG